METSTNGAHPQVAYGSSSRSNKWMVCLPVLLICGLGMWRWGFAQGRADLTSHVSKYERRLGDSEAKLRNSEVQLNQAKDELAQSRYRARLLEARSLLLRAAIDLERRNFGTANKHLHTAAAELENLPISDSANSALSTLRRDVSNTNLVVATDVERQRELVLELGDRLDRLTPLAKVNVF
ncbi:hypothetical protein EON83_21235 [bacterium]|nr:MAG: hypothetical protein EON83_21235 [bacterium]